MNLQDCGGNFALIIASSEGHTKMVKILLDHGAHVNQRNKNGMCALDNACEKGHTAVVKILLEHGTR